MEAIKLKARVRKAHLEWLEPLPDLPEGEVEVILLYTTPEAERKAVLATEWPALDGGRYLGGTLRREDLYGDDGR